MNGSAAELRHSTPTEDSPREGYQDAAQRPRVLVVDDENGPRQSLRMLLKEEYEVLLAESVDQAVGILEQVPVDVVITDIRMPHRTGIDLLQEIKQHFDEVQVIILTGFGQLDTAVQAIEGGAFAYLEKPFDNEMMLTKVRACLQKRQLEQSRRAMEYLAMEANRFETLGHLISGTMHDLGTPLSVIGTHLDLILANPEQEDSSKRLETMKAQLEYCNDLVRTTMGFVRQPSVGHGAFDLNTVAELCLNVARPFLTGRQVVAMTDLSPVLSPCHGDLILLRQAVLNLIYNAAQAMQRQEEPRHLLLKSWMEDGMACLAIQDSGPGIPKDKRERIFETLFTTKGEKGTGLGLTVVRHVMQKHGGTVELEQSEGRGARFVLRFPTV